MSGLSLRESPCRQIQVVPFRSSGGHSYARQSPVKNVFSVDLEDWGIGQWGPHAPITSRVLVNVQRILDLLERFRIRATFFALGKVCARYPALLPLISRAGHEIASHGYSHELIYNISPDMFREDLRRSIDVIREQTGKSPVGYRAPAFSIVRRTLWAGPILSEMGFRYSSSVFPVAGGRYGIPDAPPYPFRWSQWNRVSIGGSAQEPPLSPLSSCSLIEFPLTTLRRLGKRWPVCGGGYLRLLPAKLVHQAIREANGEQQPAVVYIHPYELDVSEMGELRRAGWPITVNRAIHQSLFRGFVRRRLVHLFEQFEFAPMREVLQIAE